MERPSHITFDKHQPWSRRVPFFAMAISLQLAGLWLFTHGLAPKVSDIIHDFTFVPTHEAQKPPVKPPEPPIIKRLQVIDPIPPTFTTDPQPKPGGVSSFVPPSDGGAIPNPPEHVLRAAVGIMSTHTVPPYPTVSRRIGAEGKVTLRLNVSAEGRVSRADIVTSSGRDDLDEAAQGWIVAHWTYRPAQDNGSPVASQVLAVVTFSLANER